MNEVGTLQIMQRRGGLARTARALQDGELRVGFLGGSITDARPGHNWPEPVVAWLAETFPAARIVVENAAIGATGSDLAVFRADRDIIRRGCQLVFVEYAVNDDAPSPTTRRSREGLLRGLLAGQGRDVIVVYTFNQPMFAPMMAGTVPASIAEFEELAAHYDVPSVWMGLHALREVMAGRMRWEEWLPDGLHPQARGSLSYAQSVLAYLAAELRDAPTTALIASGADRPAPLDPRHWENASILSWADVELTGPWTLRRWPHLVWMDQVLATAAVGARLSFRFRGRGLALGFDFGTTSAEFRYRLDGGAWVVSARDRPEWCAASGWYRLSVLAEDLMPGDHTCELEVVHGDDPRCTGTNFHLALIGILPA
jgi:hypothetical protein